MNKNQKATIRRFKRLTRGLSAGELWTLFGECIRITSPEAITMNAEIHGWRSKKTTKETDIPELIALIHSELSEALEAYRNHIKPGKPGCIGEEMADTVIRIFHFCELFGINITDEVRKKHLANFQRPFKHGNKRC